VNECKPLDAGAPSEVATTPAPAPTPEPVDPNALNVPAALVGRCRLTLSNPS